MKLLSGASGKIFVISLVVIVVAAILLLTFFSSGGQPTPTVPPPAPPELVTLDNQINAQDFPYVAVSDADTLFVTNKQEKKLVINLDHRHWLHPEWSLDGKQISVLGLADPATGKAIYDLYLYTLSTNTWERMTFFGRETNGITGYAWREDGTIIFTQGVAPENWMHTFTIASKEQKKIFKVNGNLELFIRATSIYIVKSNKGSVESPAYAYDFFKGDGSILQSFFSTLDTNPPVKLLAIYPGRNDKEFLFARLIDRKDEVVTYQAWSFDEPTFHEQRLFQNPAFRPVDPVSAPVSVPSAVSYFPICAADANKYWVYSYTDRSDGLSLISFPFSFSDASPTYDNILTTLNIGKSIVVDNSHIYCGKFKALLPVKSSVNNKTVTTWYLVENDKLVEQPLLLNATQAVVR